MYYLFTMIITKIIIQLYSRLQIRNSTRRVIKYLNLNNAIICRCKPCYPTVQYSAPRYTK